MIISCVSGAQINDIQKRLGNDKVEVIRAMPNTAIAFGESMTCVAGLTKQSKGLQITKQIFDHLGVALIVNEDQIVPATGLIKKQKKKKAFFAFKHCCHHLIQNGF